jgi:MFS family permease
MSTAATINALVALAGYFCAAAIIDTVGRVRLQQYGFIITGMLFVGCGLFYDKLPSNCLVWMYFCSSFFGQCGPNSTTFVIPAEIFPTEMRTMCHGIAAAAGKLGALHASILFSHVENPTNLFLWSGYASFTAAVVTFCLIPETTELNLYETDRRWRMILEGRKGDYVGQATMPKFLSFYERQRMGLNH